MVVLIIIVGVVVQITDQTSRIWRNSNARIQTFQEARAAFESMTRNLSQATLNTYYDYYDASHRARSGLSGADLVNFVPDSYDRMSDLHFISGQAGTLLSNSPAALTTQTHAVFFQAPLGYSVAYQQLDKSLNPLGYFLVFDDASEFVPDHILNAPGYEPRHRFRLMEMTGDTESLGIYDPDADTPNDWFVGTAAVSSRIIAENVIALVLLPKLSPHEDDPARTGKGVSLAPGYNYNSRVPLAAESDPSWAGASPPFPPDAFSAYPVDGTTVQASRHHQLPPLMQVVMVVIDETSADQLQGSGTTPPRAIDLAGTDLFTDASQLDADIRAVENICNATPGNLTGNLQKLNYRVFNTDIILREAKWSNN